MPPETIWTASPVIQAHAACTVAALGLGAVVLWGPKGTRGHRVLGRLWVALMLGALGTSLLIGEGSLAQRLSPIHVLVPLTLHGLAQSVWAIVVRRDVRAHRAAMRDTYLYALVVAGAFTLLPGRRMHVTLFGPEAGAAPSWVVIGAVLLALAALRSGPGLRRATRPAP